MAIELIFETHSISEDNERGVATGWLPGRLSARGRELSRELGRRRRDDGLAAVFCSDLARAAETAEIAFAGTAVPVLLDWRLRECDYGERNGTSAAWLHETRAAHIDLPYPAGESWRQAVRRVGWFLEDLRRRHAGQRIGVIGHVATRWGLDHLISGIPLETLAGADFGWRPGWDYTLADHGDDRGER